MELQWPSMTCGVAQTHKGGLSQGPARVVVDWGWDYDGGCLATGEGQTVWCRSGSRLTGDPTTCAVSRLEEGM